nr:F-box domain-containing protein [Cedratvirus lena]WIL04564.1 F-box domain-containing protein [Cedratvirus duvanny]
MSCTEENIISVLPEEILEHIFSFSGTYNAVNAAVCKDFRRIAPEVNPLVHLDHLLSCGQKPKHLSLLEEDFCKVVDMVQRAVHMQLLCILEAYKGYVPGNLCQTGVRLGLVKVLYWARSQEYKKDRFPWYGDAESTNPDVLEWMAKQGVTLFIQPPYMANFD